MPTAANAIVPNRAFVIRMFPSQRGDSAQALALRPDAARLLATVRLNSTALGAHGEARPSAMMPRDAKRYRKPFPVACVVVVLCAIHPAVVAQAGKQPVDPLAPTHGVKSAEQIDREW
jgi:hypothetical protein